MKSYTLNLNNYYKKSCTKKERLICFFFKYCETHFTFVKSIVCIFFFTISSDHSHYTEKLKRETVNFIYASAIYYPDNNSNVNADKICINIDSDYGEIKNFYQGKMSLIHLRIHLFNIYSINEHLKKYRVIIINSQVLFF